MKEPTHTIVYKSKTQTITASSSTEAEFIAAHTAGKLTRYSRMVLMQLGFEQKGPTLIHIDNLPALILLNVPVTVLSDSSNFKTGEGSQRCYINIYMEFQIHLMFFIFDTVVE